MNCPHCQEQLLHLLYDVLDPEERAQISQHLEECAACRAVNETLRQKQDLLAEAAKESFAEVSFQPPTGASERRPATLPVFPRRQRGFSWVRVATAAAILLLALGGGGMGLRGWWQTKADIASAESRRDLANQQLTAYRQRIEQEKERTRAEVKVAQEELNRLFDEWTKKANEARRQQQEQPALQVQAPRSVPAGANVPIQVNLENLDAPRAAPMAAKMKAEKGAAGKDVPAPTPPATSRLAPQSAAKEATAKSTAAGAQVQLQLNDKTRNLAMFKETQAAQPQNRFNLPANAIPPGVDVNNLALDVAYVDKDGKVRAREEVSLTAPEYLTHLMTDRPMYRPSEAIRFRSLTLERFSLKPAQEDLHLVYRLLGPNQQEIAKLEGATLVRDANNQPIEGPDKKPLRGLGAGEFTLPADAPGGQYTLTVSEAQNRFPPEKRAVLVSQWQMPRMNKELKFHRSSYGPDEVVEVEAQAKRVEGGAPLGGQPVQVRATVDSRLVYAAPLQTNAEGKIRVTFKLPPAERVPHGIGTVSVEFNDGAGPETIVRPIPIVLNKLFIEFFPEGGDLVAGVKNRVYFDVKNTLAKPAELKGHIVDQAGTRVAEVETLHDDQEEGINQGEGAFTFVPAAGKRYELKIDTPIGIQGKHPLPVVKSEGVVLHLTKSVAGPTIDAEVTSADKQRLLMVAGYCRGRLIDQRQIVASAGKPAAVTLKTEPSVSGVYRVTVYEVAGKGEQAQFLPRAERLTFRKATERLEVALDNRKQEYAPGDRVALKLKSTNEKKEKTPAVALVSVVDLSVFKLADDKTERAMPTHFLLTTEIRKPEDLENADVLLGSHPKAEAALDLLLGTQGWRRFAEQDPQRFQQKEPRDAQRIMPALAMPTQRRDSVNDVVNEKVDKVYAVKAVKVLEQLAQKEAVENGPPDAAQQEAGLQTSVQAAEMALRDARVQLREYENRVMQYLLGSVVIAALLLGLGAIVLGVRRLGQGRPALAALVTGTALLLFLFMGSLAGVFYMIGSNGQMPLAFNRNMAIEEERNAAQVAMAAKGAMPPPAAMPAPAAPVPKLAADAALPQGAVEEAKKADAAPTAEALAKRVAEADQAVDRIGGGPQGQLRAQVARGGPAAMPPLTGPQGGAMPAPGGAGIQGGFAGAVNGAPAMGFGGGPAQQQIAQQQIAQQQMQNGGGGAFQPNFFGARAAQMGERELRQEGNFQEIFRRRMNRDIPLPPVLPPLIVREYAHQHIQNGDGAQQRGQEAIRRDFTETVFWQPAVILAGGEAEIAFDLSDAVTRYQVTVQSHSLDGRLGAKTFELAARLPFSIDPKVPFEISNTDKVIVPVAVKNDTDQPGRVELSAKASGLKTQDPQTRDVDVDAKGRNRGFFAYEAAQVSGDALLRVKGSFNANLFGTDTVERSFKIVPDGFPIRGSASGLLEKAAVHEINLPASWVPGTLQCQVQVFPSTLAELQKGLEGLLREPCGCFEQSSSSNYPNVLILNYLQEAGQGDPAVEKRARALLQNGYQRLTSFECIDPKDTSKRGYEWFGQTAPPHEALTAYGLLQFHDMAKLYPVDNAMVERTRKYLLDQRDGQGGFKRNPRAIDSFGRAPEHITSAYIAWALVDAGAGEDLTKELAALAKRAADSKDPYFVALVSLAHLGGGKPEEGVGLAKKLKDAQKDDGRLEGTAMSITGSQGRDLSLETTALSVLAWLRANRPDEFHTSVDKAVKWITSQRSGQGSFGATQSTILALKALIAHTREAKKLAEDGKVSVTLPQVKDVPVAETSFTAGASEPITVAVAENRGLQPGKNKLIVETTAKNAFPYTVSWSYRTLTPPSDAGCPVKLSAKLNKQEALEGDTVKLHATVENTTDKGYGMTLAILGLPAGLSVPEDAKQLKEMAKLRDNGATPGVISHWELRGRELILYWRDLAPKAKIDVEVDLVCRLPGTYRGPASRAYLYYNADHKDWIEPLQITIDPQRGE